MIRGGLSRISEHKGKKWFHPTADSRKTVTRRSYTFPLLKRSAEAKAAKSIIIEHWTGCECSYAQLPWIIEIISKFLSFSSAPHLQLYLEIGLERLSEIWYSVDGKLCWKSNKLKCRVFTRAQIDERVENSINHIIYSNFRECLEFLLRARFFFGSSCL